MRQTRRTGDGTAQSRNHRPPGRAGVQEGYWRRVPKVDVLPRRQVKFSASLVVTGLLVLVLVLGAFLALKEYRERVDVDSTIVAKTAQLQSLQGQLSAKQQEVEPLRSEISKLKSQLDGAEKAYRQVTVGHLNWYGAIEALLLKTETPGVRFSSVTAKPGGGVTLVGQATNPQTMAAFLKQLNDVSSAIEFQGIQWRSGSDPPEFTASFRVRP